MSDRETGPFIFPARPNLSETRLGGPRGSCQDDHGTFLPGTSLEIRRRFWNISEPRCHAGGAPVIECGWRESAERAWSPIAKAKFSSLAVSLAESRLRHQAVQCHLEFLHIALVIVEVRRHPQPPMPRRH